MIIYVSLETSQQLTPSEPFVFDGADARAIAQNPISLSGLLLVFDFIPLCACAPSLLWEAGTFWVFLKEYDMCWFHAKLCKTILTKYLLN